MTDITTAYETLLRASSSPLELVTVTDRNKPNLECIHLFANDQVSLGQYLLFVGARLPDGDAIPLQSHLFWFGRHVVASQTWIMIYTGPGEPVLTTQTFDKKPALVFHWNKQHTIFTDTQLVPCLIRIDPTGVQIGHRVE